jgi:prepilin-type N-terminal cleavage/methylation domain-containing protein
MLTDKRAGFTLVEICIALVILSAAVLGMAASTGRMLQPTGDAEVDFQALQSVEDRLAEISLDPRYTLLDSIYAGTETNLPGLTNATRVTAVTRTKTAGTGGAFLDYQTIVVTVSGGRLKQPVFRKLIMGSP